MPKDPDYRHQKWHMLTAHLLQGIEITPQNPRPVNHLVATLPDSKQHKIFVSGNQDKDPESISLSSAPNCNSSINQLTLKPMES